MSKWTAASLVVLACVALVLDWRVDGLRIELAELRRDHEALINVLGEREPFPVGCPGAEAVECFEAPLRGVVR